jgi:hypothetical protein
MGKYYQTADRNFRDDFLYQPPMELIQAALAKKDAEIQNQLDTLEILGQLPVNYWKEADEENVKNIQERYARYADEVSKMYQRDPLNPENKTALNMIKKELQKDYQTGELSKIAENLFAYNKFQQEYNTLDDTAKSVYANMVQNYLNEVNSGEGGSTGALNQIFKPSQMMKTRDFFKEWVEVMFKNMFPYMTVTDMSTSDKLKVMKEKGLTAETLSDSYQKYIRSHQDVPAYAANRQAIGEDNYLNPDGSVSFDPNSFFGRQLQAAITFAYQQNDMDIGGKGSGGSGSGGGSRDAYTPPLIKKVAQPYQMSNTLSNKFYTIFSQYTDTSNIVIQEGNTQETLDKAGFDNKYGKTYTLLRKFLEDIKSGKKVLLDTNLNDLVNAEFSSQDAIAQSGWSSVLQSNPNFDIGEMQKIVAANMMNVDLEGYYIGDVNLKNVRKLSTLYSFDYTTKETKNGKTKYYHHVILDVKPIESSIQPFIVDANDVGKNSFVGDVEVKIKITEVYQNGNPIVNTMSGKNEETVVKYGQASVSMKSLNFGGNWANDMATVYSTSLNKIESEIKLVESEISKTTDATKKANLQKRLDKLNKDKENLKK